MAEGRLLVEPGFRVTHITTEDNRLRIGAGSACSGRHAVVDELIVATGFRPDLSFLRELRIALDPALECPLALAPLIDPNEHSCGTVRPHGARELAQPEPGFYFAGMKSYGRAPTFLMLTGYEQVRSIAADIAGDRAAAERVELVFPETGVCSRPQRRDRLLWRLRKRTQRCVAGERPGAGRDVRLLQSAVAGVSSEGGPLRRHLMKTRRQARLRTQGATMPPAADQRLYNVLFSAGNSARSIIAEAILNRSADDFAPTARAASRRDRSIRTIALLQNLNHDTRHSFEIVDGFVKPGAPASISFTVCDRSGAGLNRPGRPMTAHWDSRPGGDRD